MGAGRGVEPRTGETNQDLFVGLPPILDGTLSLPPELERVSWVAGVAIEAHGVRLGIRVDEPTLLPRLKAYLPYAWAPVLSSPAPVQRLFSLQLAGSGGQAVLHVDEEEACRSFDVKELFPLIQIVSAAFVAEMTPHHVFVHAGAVELHGRAILVPGVSYSGKTTLVAELVRAGATYYSDEYAVLDDEGYVHPYPQLLGLRRPGSSDHEWIPVDDLGGNTGISPIRVGLIVVTRYETGATWQPSRLSRAEGLQVLLVNARATRRRPEEVLDVLERAERGALILGGLRGEAPAAARAILEAVDSDRTTAP
jgi:hypothetical protein